MLLLDESPVEFDTSASIITHIAGRPGQFGQTSAAQVKRFEEAVAAQEPRNRKMEWLNDTIVSNREVAER